MLSAQSAHIIEAEYFGAFAEAEPIRRQYPKVPRQRRDGELPRQLSAAAKFARVQQHNRKAVTGFQVMRAHSVDQNKTAGKVRHRIPHFGSGGYYTKPGLFAYAIAEAINAIARPEAGRAILLRAVV